MSKKNETVRGYGPAYVMMEYIPDYLVGRILTFVETLSLPEKQEVALKGLIKQEIWDQFGPRAEYDPTLFINGSLHNEIRRVMEELRDRAVTVGTNSPIGVHDSVEFTVSWKDRN